MAVTCRGDGETIVCIISGQETGHFNMFVLQHFILYFANKDLYRNSRSWQLSVMPEVKIIIFLRI